MENSSESYTLGKSSSMFVLNIFRITINLHPFALRPSICLASEKLALARFHPFLWAQYIGVGLYSELMAIKSPGRENLSRVDSSESREIKGCLILNTCT